jgi:hypothetical protein
MNILHEYNDGIQIDEAGELHRVRVYGSLSACADVHSGKHGRKIPIIGFSATFARNDTKKLAWIYQDVVFHQGIEALWKDK